MQTFAAYLNWKVKASLKKTNLWIELPKNY